MGSPARDDRPNTADPVGDDQFRSLFEHGGDAVILATPEGAILAANPAACRVFGRSEAEIRALGRSGLVDPTDGRLPRLLEERARTSLFKGELRLRRGDGSSFPAEVSSAFYRDRSGAMRASIIIRDVTERRRIEQHRAAQHDVTRALAESVSLAQAGPRLLRAVCEALGWDFGALWLVDDPARLLRCEEVFRPAADVGGELEAASRGRTFAAGEGLPGCVWSSGEPIWVAELELDRAPGAPRARLAARSGLHAAAAFPIGPGDEVLGVFEVFSREQRAPDPVLLDTMAALGAQIGQFIARTRSESLIQTTAVAVASATGDEFFRALVRHLATALGARHAFVTECSDAASRHVRMLAWWRESGFAEPVEYDLAGTPCEAVVRGEEAWVPADLPARFPADLDLETLGVQSYLGLPLRGAGGAVIGHLVAMDDKPMRNDPRGLPVLRIFAARAAAELARLASDRQLRQANRFLQAIVDGVEEGIIVYDQDLRYVVFNRFMERMHGRAAADVLGRRAPEVFPWIRESRIDAMIERALHGEAVQAPELLLRRPGKSDVWQFARYGPLRDARGAIAGAIALVSDITERRQADQALRATNRFLQEIIDEAAEGIVVFDRELRFVVFNRFMERLHDRPAADVLGKVAPEVFPFLREAGVDAMIQRAIEGEAVEPRELLLQRPGGGDVWQSYRVGPHRDAAGNIIGAIALVADITARHRSEAALRQANAEIAALNRQLEAENVYLRRDLIANVSHDLRTPLAALHGYLETLLVKGDELPEDKRRAYLETAARQSEHLGTLIAELFELVKLDFRGFEPRREPVQLGELAQDVLQKFQLAAEERGIALRSEIEPQLPLAAADISLIERALDNLIDNALRHTSAGGTVTLEVAAADEGIRIGVADTGSGIAPADLARIFDRFYRADRSRSARTGGAGLGLAIVKRIVDLHGASIRVESALGAGTAFSFSLPAIAR